MCGTVGLFTGCAAAVFCPVKQLQKASEGDAQPESNMRAYRSAFTTWDTKSAVRSSPRRELSHDQFTTLFPRELVPVAGHRIVAELPPELFNKLLAQHLYRYLHFTAKLEYLVVNHVALGIAHGSIKVPVPEQMKFDALKIYCDEAYHALFSVDLMRQIAELTGITSAADDEPFFMRRLAALKAERDPDRSNLIDVLFTIVSETLISATLSEVVTAGDVAPAVLESVRDHARDEGRHHAYFASYLHYLWASLDHGERRFAGRIFPELIDVFLRPDLPTLRTELAGYGIHDDDIETVLAETFSERIQAEYNRATASKLIGYLHEVGVFDESGARDEALSRGMLLSS